MAFGKQQPENIANPVYESSPSAPPEDSCDPFPVSLSFPLGKGSAGERDAGMQDARVRDAGGGGRGMLGCRMPGCRMLPPRECSGAAPQEEPPF